MRDLLIAAIKQDRHEPLPLRRSRTAHWALGDASITFAASAFKSASTARRHRHPRHATTPSRSSSASTARPRASSTRAASGTIDVNVLNSRNWVDVTFAAPTAPAGLRIDVGSITDLAPEFVLAGAGLGSLALDAARAPTLLTETAATTASFRYWLTGVRGTGAITLTYLAGTWAFNVAALDNTTTTATATISGGNAPDHDRGHAARPGRAGRLHARPDARSASTPSSSRAAASPTARAGRSCSTRCARRSSRARPVSGCPGRDHRRRPARDHDDGHADRSRRSGLAYSGATTGGTAADTPIDVSAAIVGNRTFVDVAFTPGVGRDLVLGSIDGNEFALSGFGGSGVTVSSGPLKALHVGNNVFRFMLDGQFRPGRRGRHVHARLLERPGARTPGRRHPRQPWLHADLRRRRLHRRPRPHRPASRQAIVALGGSTIGRDALNTLGYLEVTFRAPPASASTTPRSTAARSSSATPPAT